MITNREIIRLLATFCVLDDNDINSFCYDHDDPRLEEPACTLIIKRPAVNVRIVTTEKYPDGTILRIAKKRSFSHQDEMILANLVSTINTVGQFLTYYDLHMVLTNVQLNALLRAICMESGGKQVPVLQPCTCDIITCCIIKMEEWASQTYENHKISFVIGMDPWTDKSSCVHIRDLYNDDMLKVLGSGRNTIIVCNKDGEIIGYEKLESDTISMVPLSFGRIAGWSRNKLAVILTLLGEILIVYDQRLVYLKHDSRWFAGRGSPIGDIMSKERGYDTGLKNAILDTCFDASFGRCGSCLGIVDQDCPLIFEIDRFEIAKTPRANFFRNIVGKRKFQEIEREIRQDLVNIDGATVMDKSGNILAIGAILMLNPRQMQERTTGGRSVAAQQLAEYGIGIKISEDGNVEAWRKTEVGNVEKIVAIL